MSKINTTDEKDKSKGKFHALLKFRAKASDIILKDHLVNEAANTQYISTNTKNILIKMWSQKNRVSFFSIMVDEMTNIATL